MCHSLIVIIVGEVIIGEEVKLLLLVELLPMCHSLIVIIIVPCEIIIVRGGVIIGEEVK